MFIIKEVGFIKDDLGKFIDCLVKEQEYKFKEAVSNMVGAQGYVNRHKHIYYCEIIINRDGLIAEAHPSHTEFLRMYAGLSNEELMELDKECNYTPLGLLLKHTGCVAVWYNNYEYDGELSDNQVAALNTLIDAKVVKFEL